MSAQVKHTRGELYNEYMQNNNSIAAKKILGKEYSSVSAWMEMVSAFLAASIVAAAIFLGVIGGVTNGFAPVQGNFYPAVCSALFVPAAVLAVGNLIAIAICYSKKQNILAEPLSETDVIEITATPLKEVNER